MVRLGDIFDAQITGEWGNECEDNENATNVIRTTNFTHTGVIDYKNIAKRDIAQSKIEKKRLHEGDIILEKSGGTDKTPVGRVVYCDDLIEKDIYLCNNFTQAMRVNIAAAFPKYVFYYMWFLHYSGITDLLQNKTTGIRNLKIREYLNEEIPLPSLDEQRKIAAVLDKISDLTAKRRRQLDKLDELVKSRFVEMFGDPVINDKSWPHYKISDFASVKIGPFGSMLHAEDYVLGEHPLVNPLHISDGVITPDFSLSLNAQKQEELVAYQLLLGDVVIGRRGEIGRCAVVKTSGMFCGTGCMFVRVFKDCRPDYLQYVISYPTFSSMLEDKAVGITMKNLNAGIIEDSDVYLPPLSMQDEFILLRTRIKKLKLLIESSLNKLETIKRAFMQEYFYMR